MNYKDEVNRSMQTLHEMLRDRHIENVDEVFERLSINEVIGILHSRQIFNIDIGTQIRIIFDVSSKVKIPELRKFVEAEPECNLYIFVTREKLGATESKKIAEIRINDKKIEHQLFDLRELQFNISKHSLVPKHELITDDAAIESIVTDHMLKSRHQMPIILKTDPMAKYLYAKPGNLVRITRYSPTSGEHIVYRCCM